MIFFSFLLFNFICLPLLLVNKVDQKRCKTGNG